MRRVIVLVLIVVVLAVVALAVMAPASLVSSRIEKATGGAMTFRSAEGTVWNGRGVLTGAGAQLPLSWNVEPTPLASGDLRAHITPFDSTSTTPRADIKASRDAVSLRNVDAVLPASLISEALANTRLRGFGILAQGDIAVATPQLDWRPGAVDGQAQIVWRTARLTLPPLPPLELGDVTATLVGDGVRMAGPVANQGGDLDVRGNVSVGADKSASVALTIAPRDMSNPNLARLTALLGEPTGGGWHLNWQTPPR